MPLVFLTAKVFDDVELTCWQTQILKVKCKTEVHRQVVRAKAVTYIKLRSYIKHVWGTYDKVQNLLLATSGINSSLRAIIQNYPIQVFKGIREV